MQNNTFYAKEDFAEKQYKNRSSYTALCGVARPIFL